MNCSHQIMILVAMITTSFSAAAQEVYESVDQQGVVEFSDQPGAGAREVDVRPNVVDVAPVPPVETSPPASTTGAVEAPGGSVQPEVIHEGVAGDYYGDNEKRREMYREHQETPERGAEAQPVRKETGREAVHKGGHRR
jgi:hypothetical protein